jgi:hypothetical protein
MFIFELFGSSRGSLLPNYSNDAIENITAATAAARATVPVLR